MSEKHGSNILQLLLLRDVSDKTNIVRALDLRLYMALMQLERCPNGGMPLRILG